MSTTAKPTACNCSCHTDGELCEQCCHGVSLSLSDGWSQCENVKPKKMSRIIDIPEYFKEFTFQLILERLYEVQQRKDHPPDMRAVRRFLKKLANLKKP